MRIMVTGGTGFIGRDICYGLINRGDTPVVVTRNASTAKNLFGSNADLETWDTIRSGDAMVRIDKVINLAGSPLLPGRWNEAVKQELVSSRVDTTRQLVYAMEAAEKPPTVLVSASAVGYYGPGERMGLGENAPPGDDFLAGLAVDWEAAAARAESFGVRVAIIRTGIVLGSSGGALPKLAQSFRRHVGGTIGTGEQWVSWIDIDDLVSLYLFALDNDQARGPINGTSPVPVKMRALTDKIGDAMGRRSWLDAPAFALKLMFGEGANALLTGQHVVPKKARELGLDFKHKSLDETLRRHLATETG